MSWSKKFLAPVRKLETSKRPSRHGDGQAEFVLLIALALQRQETKTLLSGLLQQRTVHRSSGGAW